MLLTKQIGQWTVTQAGMREAVRRVNMAKEIQAGIEQGLYEPDLITALSIYPSIAACISPVMSIDEYLQTPEQELDALSIAAIELNPHWFAMGDNQKKTTQKKRKRSTKK